MNQEEAIKKYDRMIRFVLHRTVPRVYHEDCYQDCILELPKVLENYKPEMAKFSTYFYYQIRKIATRYVRYHKRLQSDEIPEQTSPEDIENEYLKKEVRNALEKLTNFEKEIIYLYYYEGLLLQEISDILGLNLKTLSRRMNVAIDKMRRMLVEHR